MWVAVGGTPKSVARAGMLGLPLTIAIIGGEPARFVPLVELYRDAASRAAHDPGQLPVAINTHGFVADTAERARAAFAPAYMSVMNRVGRERGWPPMGRAQFEALAAPHGALAIGVPEQVAEKILYEHELFANARFMAQMTVGDVPHTDVMRSIELFGTEVAPLVRAEVGSSGGPLVDEDRDTISDDLRVREP